MGKLSRDSQQVLQKTKTVVQKGQDKKKCTGYRIQEQLYICTLCKNSNNHTSHKKYYCQYSHEKVLIYVLVFKAAHTV